MWSPPPRLNPGPFAEPAAAEGVVRIDVSHMAAIRVEWSDGELVAEQPYSPPVKSKSELIAGSVWPLSLRKWPSKLPSTLAIRQLVSSCQLFANRLFSSISTRAILVDRIGKSIRHTVGARIARRLAVLSERPETDSVRSRYLAGLSVTTPGYQTRHIVTLRRGINVSAGI